MYKTDDAYQHVNVFKPLPNSGKPVEIEIVPRPEEDEEKDEGFNDVE